MTNPAPPPTGPPPPGWQPPQPPYGYPYPHPPPRPRSGSGATVAIVLGVVFGAILLIGILAAVAIPAFLKSSKKVKRTESAINVKRLYAGARTYYEEESGHGSPKQFPDPPEIPTQPALGTCCQSPGHKCAPDPQLWTDPSWQALRFSMDDPHYFSYTYEANGRGESATFSARANGDLDCDAVYSTFEIVGSVQHDGTVTGAAGYFVDRELE